MKKLKTYGKEIIIDLHNCDASTFTRKSLKEFFKQLCVLLDMTPEKLVWWDDLYTRIKDRETEPHLVGTSAVQFIRTSNITIHTLDLMDKVYLNIFSCKNFKEKVVIDFAEKWFKGERVACYRIPRI